MPTFGTNGSIMLNLDIFKIPLNKTITKLVYEYDTANNLKTCKVYQINELLLTIEFTWDAASKLTKMERI